jgi:hypothetical protein
VYFLTPQPGVRIVSIARRAWLSRRPLAAFFVNKLVDTEKNG